MWRCVTPASDDFQAPLRRGFSFALLHLEQGFSFFSALPAAHSQPDFKALFTAFLLRRYRILPAVKRALWALAGVGACTAQYSRIQPSTAQYSPVQRRTCPDQAPQHRGQHLERLTVCAWQRVHWHGSRALHGVSGYRVRHCRHSQRSEMQPAGRPHDAGQDASQREQPERPRRAADQPARGRAEG